MVEFPTAGGRKAKISNRAIASVEYIDPGRNLYAPGEVPESQDTLIASVHIGKSGISIRDGSADGVHGGSVGYRLLGMETFPTSTGSRSELAIIYRLFSD